MGLFLLIPRLCKIQKAHTPQVWKLCLAGKEMTLPFLHYVIAIRVKGFYCLTTIMIITFWVKVLPPLIFWSLFTRSIKIFFSPSGAQPGSLISPIHLIVYE